MDHFAQLQDVEEETKNVRETEADQIILSEPDEYCNSLTEYPSRSVEPRPKTYRYQMPEFEFIPEICHG